MSTWPKSTLERCITIKINETLSKTAETRVKFYLYAIQSYKFFTRLSFQLYIIATLKGVRGIIAELHSKDQSLLPQEFPEDRIYRLKENVHARYRIKPTINQNLKTRRQDCKVDNTGKVKKCFDEFYVSKLNCTFPWLSNSTKTCGSEEKIIDLMRLMKDSGNVNSSLYGEMIDFGCKVPNCREKIWTITKTESFNFKQNGSRIDLDFSSSKVSNHYLCTSMNPDFLQLSNYRSKCLKKDLLMEQVMSLLILEESLDFCLEQA